MIYYQKDKVAKPETWQQLYAEAAKAPGNGFVYQGKQYEGLTVNFLEMLYSAGGEVLNDQGDVKIDSKETRDVLNFMSDGLKNGSADRAVLTYNEDPARLAYESGDFGYQRNWPHVYRLLNATPLASSFAVAPLPHGKAARPLACWAAGTWPSRPTPPTRQGLSRSSTSPPPRTGRSTWPWTTRRPR